MQYTQQRTGSSTEGQPRESGFERRAFRADRVTPRRTSFSFPEDIPKLWVGGSHVRTHVMNSLHLFLPPFERMITRLVRDALLHELADPHLKRQALGFMRQEAVHGRVHTQFLGNLEAQGYDLAGYMRFVEWFFSHLLAKKLGPKISLSITAAFEHYTDILVLLILKSDFLDGCDPRMKELFAWHAAEEVEHHAVAYDMLRALDSRYSLRMLGNVLVVPILVGFITGGAALLLHQDGKLAERETAKGFHEFFFTKYGIAPEIARLFRLYARRDYQRDHADYAHLAKAVLDPLSAA
jgi:uncharacterized protein